MKLLKHFFKTIKGIFRKKKKKSRRPARRPVKRSRKIKARPRRQRKTAIKKKRLVRRKPLKRVKPKRSSAAKIIPAKAKEPKPDPGVWVGDITHYFSKIMVCVVKMRSGPLNVRDRIRIQGHSTNFTQTVDSLQIESVDVKSARRGQLVGLKTAQPARPGDKVFKLGLGQK